MDEWRVPRAGRARRGLRVVSRMFWECRCLDHRWDQRPIGVVASCGVWSVARVRDVGVQARLDWA